jgi:precorrin-6B C5,15-methyltransferase / cobalt-precorrin-6B C5,C15-methyltransferase
MGKWLTIIGMGEDGFDGLSAQARHAIAGAQHIVGSERLLSFLPAHSAQQHLWPQPFSKVIDCIKPLAGTATIVLATGDPMNFGAARKLMEIVPFDEMQVIPHVSAFSLAAARIGWSLPDCDCLTIHGRPAANLEAFIQPQARLLVLTQDETSIAEIARRLVARGFENSPLHVLENLGGPREQISTFPAHDVPSQAWSPLNIVGIECVAGLRPHIFSRIGGLPDAAFIHDGQLTKREVRAATLAALAPAPDQLLWDIGAGCGSVAIEWMRSTRGCNAVAFEHNAERLNMIAANADALGTPRLKIVGGTAPACLRNAAQPDAVFIGGGIGNDGVFETAWTHLKTRGRLVANVVTVEGEMHLFDLQEKHGGELVKIDIAILDKVGPYRVMKPRMGVLQWRVQKPW